MKNETRGLRCFAVLTVVLVCLAVQVVFTLPAYGHDIVGWGNQPLQDIPSANAAKITAGFNYSLAIKSDGSTIGWGDNWSEQASPPEGNDFTALAAGYRHGLALKSDGSIVGWGYNGAARAMPPAGNNFVAVAAGVSHSLALTSNGSIAGWGSDALGQAAPPDGNDFVAIAAGFNHSLALSSDGSVVVWGWGIAATPLEGNDFIAIAAGGWHNLALRSDGSIVGWGGNWAGQATPPEGNDFVAIAAGDDYSLALKSDGSIVGWGDNRHGQATPPQGNDFIAIAAGALHGLALLNTAPVAEAGPDQTVYALINGKANVLLNGSDSNDADDDALTCKWSWPIGPIFCEANGVNPEIELPIGVHTIQLVVNDGSVDSEPNEVNITVIGPVEANLCVMPKVLNYRSFQPKITAMIRLPKGITRDQIDTNEPILLYPGQIEADWKWISRYFDYKCRAWNTTIFASFDKDELMDAIPNNGQVELVVVGQLTTGQYFFGTDNVRVISPGKWPWHKPWWNYKWNRFCQRPDNYRH